MLADTAIQQLRKEASLRSRLQGAHFNVIVLR